MATHFSILENMEEPGGLQSMRLQSCTQLSMIMPLSVAITGIANQPQHHPHATTEETERDGNVDPGPTKLGSNGAKPGVGNQTDAASLRFRQARVCIQVFPFVARMSALSLIFSEPQFPHL